MEQHMVWRQMPSRRFLILAVVLGMAVGSATTLIAQRWLSSNRDLKQAEHQQREGPPATPNTITTDVLIQGEPTLGHADAPVTILEFSDFECPYCQQFHNDVMAKLKSTYIEKGLVRFVHKDLPMPFHKHAVPAAAAARCAGDQTSYWQVYSALFKEQTCLSCKGVMEIAGSVIDDTTSLQACMNNPRTLALIEANRSEASLLGIQATPTFVIGPTLAEHRHRGTVIEGALPWPAFKEAVDQALKRTGQPSTPGNEGDTTTKQSPP